MTYSIERTKLGGEEGIFNSGIIGLETDNNGDEGVTVVGSKIVEVIVTCSVSMEVSSSNSLGE